MRALIINVLTELEGRFVRSLPPEHRVVARRDDPSTKFASLIVEGPMLPEVVDGEYLRGDLLLTMLCDDDPPLLRLEGCFHWSGIEWSASCGSAWEIGRWSSRAEMQAALHNLTVVLR
jgi:hypothetical protein